MTGLKLKKKNLKQRRETLLKAPSTILGALLEATRNYYEDLNTDDRYDMPINGGKTIRMMRYDKTS